MLCQHCNENEANVKYTQIINGVKKQMNLCDKCAKDFGIDNISFDMQMDFSNFLGDFFDDIDHDFIPSLVKPKTLLCDKCGSSYDDFVKNGKFGCAECYNVFQNKVDNLLKNINGVNKHIGRTGKIGKLVENEVQQTNKEISKEQKIKELQIRLKQEIKEERYEEAAKTRDEIKKLQ